MVMILYTPRLHTVLLAREAQSAACISETQTHSHLQLTAYITPTGTDQAVSVNVQVLQITTINIL